LIALRDAGTGREAQITHDSAGLPQSLTDSWSGVRWDLTVDTARRRISSVRVSTRPDIVWSYNYDGQGNLLSVLAPGGTTWRTYEYVSNRMTASRDALGNLIESHTYDANGYGISSTGPSDEIDLIEYNLPGETAEERVTRVTYKSGAIAEYALRRSGGGYRPARISGGCGSCGARDVTYVRDARGRIIREQEADGTIDVFVYDPSSHNLISKTTSMQPFGCDPATDPGRCRLKPEQLAEVGLLGTRSTQTSVFEYGDANWPERPTVIRIESIINVVSGKESFVGGSPRRGRSLETGDVRL